MGGVNQRQLPAAQTITVNFPAAGNYPYELDFAKGGDPRVTLTMLADGAPIPAAALLTLTPARVPSTTAGAIATFNVMAVDAGGFALSNLPVTFSVAGQNEQIRTTTTDGVGAAGVAYTGSPLRIGRDTIQAAARVAGLDVYSNVVTVQWNTGVNSGPMVSAGSNLV